MNRIKVFTVLCICMLTVPLSAQGDVDVIWQHGLAGSEESWEALAEDFAEQRRMESTRPDLMSASLRGVREMAGRVIDSTFETRGDRTIGVGHSMGGVVFREIAARESPDHLDAMVTIGSPLNGAPVADGYLMETLLTTSPLG